MDVAVDDSVNNNIFEAINSSMSYEDLCSAFICLYFSACLNKTQFDKILEFFSIITTITIPKTFDECINTLFKNFGENISGANKTWYCSKCKVFDNSIRQYERKCVSCANILTNYIYLPLENQLLKLIKKFPSVRLTFSLNNLSFLLLSIILIIIYNYFFLGFY